MNHEHYTKPDLPYLQQSLHESGLNEMHARQAISFILLVASTLVSGAHAWTSFHPNCTLPADKVSYVAAPNVRGSTNLVWTSVTTLVACTFTVLHLNVPKQYHGPAPSWREYIFRLPIWSLLFWCFVTIFVPEIPLMKALYDLQDAMVQLDGLHTERPQTRGVWTLTHMLYANLGGFVLRGESLSSDGLSEIRPTIMVGTPCTESVVLELTVMPAKDKLGGAGARALQRASTAPAALPTVQVSVSFDPAGNDSPANGEQARPVERPASVPMHSHEPVGHNACKPAWVAEDRYAQAVQPTMSGINRPSLQATEAKAEMGVLPTGSFTLRAETLRYVLARGLIP